MTQPRKCTAIRALPALVCAVVLALSGIASAEATVGTVINLSGVLLVRKADGGMKILAQQSAVDRGDILITQKAAYARIKFADLSEVTLKPDTQLAVTDFTLSASKPEDDKEVLTLTQGSVRATGGLIGKRNREHFQINTPSGSIDMGGAVIIAEYVPPSARADGNADLTRGIVMAAAYRDLRRDSPAGFYAALSAVWRTPAFLSIADMQLAQNTPPLPDGVRAPGLYVQVIDGAINLSNAGGSQNFAAGQFGFTPSIKQPPIVIPTNPGIQFTPPPAFSSTTGSQSSSNSGKSAAVDCVVR